MWPRISRQAPKAKAKAKGKSKAKAKAKAKPSEDNEEPGEGRPFLTCVLGAIKNRIHYYKLLYIYMIFYFSYLMFLMFYYLMYLSAVRLKHQFSRKVLPDLPRSPWSLPQPSWRTRSCGARKAGGLEWYLEGSAPVFADFLGVGMVPWSIETEFFTCFFSEVGWQMVDPFTAFFLAMGMSWNGDTSKLSICRWVFHYKATNLGGTLHFRGSPILPLWYHDTSHTATLLEVMRSHSRCLVEVWI